MRADRKEYAPLKREDPRSLSKPSCHFVAQLSAYGSHLLAQRRDVARGFNDALAPVVVLVKFGAERFECGHERGVFRRSFHRAWLCVGLKPRSLSAGH